MNRKQHAQRVLSDGFDKWIRGTEVAASSTQVLGALLSVEPFEIPSMLRQLRMRVYWDAFVERGVRSLDAWRGRLVPLLEKTPVELQGWMQVAGLCHPNGYARQVFLEMLDPRSVSGVLGLMIAADDHVPEIYELSRCQLAEAHLEHFARCLPVITSSLSGGRWRSWREEVLCRLVKEGASVLLTEAIRGESEAAVECWRLVNENAEFDEVRLALNAKHWKVRAAAARLAVSSGDVELSKAFLSDHDVAVRYSVVWCAAHLESPQREEILASALADRSIRVLRIVMAYVGRLPVGQQRARELISSSSSRERVAGLRLSSVLPKAEATAALESGLADAEPVVRSWSYRVLAEKGWIEEPHFELLEMERDLQVLTNAVKHISKVLEYRARLRRMMDRPRFLESGGPHFVVKTLAVWDGAPLVFRALAEDWPTAEGLQSRLMSELGRSSVSGWLGPDRSQVERIESVLENYKGRLPESAVPLVCNVEALLEIARHRHNARE